MLDKLTVLFGVAAAFVAVLLALVVVRRVFDLLSRGGTKRAKPRDDRARVDRPMERLRHLAHELLEKMLS